MRYRAYLACAAACACLLPAIDATAQRAGGDVEPLGTELVVNGLQWVTTITHSPGDTTRLFLTEKRGRIRILNLKTGELLGTSFLDIDGLITGGTFLDDERGLLGLAFHPNYQNNGKFYVNYTDSGDDTVVAEYQVSANPNLADAGSAVKIFEVFQPFVNHNGGWIGFGPNDGYLYVSMGDGGSANDPSGRAQDITDMLLGKMLRIDIDGDDFPGDDQNNYAIPPDNPFVDITGDDEIWAYGLRNPWRCSFDRANGDLYIGDVGQFSWEEITYQPASSTGGENYGWRCMEANNCTGLTGCTCFDNALTDPVHAYFHTGGSCSVTGGYVYRGCAIPSLDGTYFFGDYCSDLIWSFKLVDGGVTDFEDRTAELKPDDGTLIDRLTAFGEDARGEMYLTDHLGGEVWRIVPENPTIPAFDLDCDGGVGTTDLLLLLGSWGPCVGCVADLNGNDLVNGTDLLLLLGAWSP